MFPEELWSTLEGKSGDNVRAHLEISAQKQDRVRASQLSQRCIGLKDANGVARNSMG
jgi:hypothetical protein